MQVKKFLFKTKFNNHFLLPQVIEQKVSLFTSLYHSTYTILYAFENDLDHTSNSVAQIRKAQGLLNTASEIKRKGNYILMSSSYL